MGGLAKLTTVTFLVLNCIVWSQGGHGLASWRNSQAITSLTSRLGKRAGFSEQCAPLSYPIAQQCAHVREACPETETILSLPHLQGYFCTSPAARPAVFIGLLAWLVLLFSTLGIGASDFFCPNLATIAAVLGLDENVAGVTFLAVGNGSPDVFSTFSAMKAQSGSLAIGELLGAASFIVSVVVGSMCLIKPFRVNRGPFLRDVGFFTVAVSLLLVILHDGMIHAWEAAILVALYIVYVATVVLSSWWESRQEKKRQRELAMRGDYEDDHQPYYLEPYRDNVPVSNTSTPTLAIPPTRGRALSSPLPPPLRSASHLPRRPHSRSSNLPPQQSPGAHPSMSHLPSFSLVTALEFRDVVASLRHQTSSSSLAVFESPITPLGGRYHRHPPLRASARSPVIHTSAASEVDPWDATLDPQMHLGRLDGDPPSAVRHPSSSNGTSSSIPAISFHTPASPTSTLGDSPDVPPTRGRRILEALIHTYHILFPHLQNFSSKSIISIFVAIIATPGVLVLTITLPVVMTPYGESQTPRHPRDDIVEGRLIDFEEDGVERVLVAEDELKEELYEAQFNKWLTAVQCVLGPVFCTAMVLGWDKSVLWYLIACATIGVATGVLVLLFSDRGNDPAARLARCFMGFIVAVVWIMAIADEVVSVLKTFGLIFGLSDAIIGLTIFAVGNSLADLVANMSVAAFAPIMGFSACFGGPMLNILLGVGVSGSYIIHKTGRNYDLQFSTTLLVSTIGLLVLLVTTMVFVPWNGFFLTRRWGIFLISSYVIVMVVNIIVEVKNL